MFFDDHPEFLETSSTAAVTRRLNERHVAMIEENREVLRQARVLDIASHDGRWSFAALKAGASHVTGIEGRDHLVQNANKTFADKGIDSSHFEFVHGDAHDVLTQGVGTFDVVMCLGFIYHTLRYVELFSGIRATGARHVIIDTRVHLATKRVIAVHSNPVEKESLAIEDRFSYKGQTLVGRPSMAALEHMLGAYGYEIASQTDWSRILGPDANPANRYLTGARVTLLAVARD
jgi:protein-L-isoaspartate O-methyltransferase